MSIQAGAEKRRGKAVVKERGSKALGESLKSPIGRDYTLQEAFNLFVQVKETENVKERTKREYFVQYRYFCEWLGIHIPNIERIDEINTATVREYINFLANDKPRYDGHPFKKEELKQSKGLSPYTINIRIRFLKAFFNVLMKERIITRNPMENIKLMKVDEDTKEPLTEEEVRRLLQQPNQRLFAQFRDYVMLMLLIDTGMRVNEICSLEVEEIDFKSRCINLPASKNKNRKMRIIPLSGEVNRLLFELINETRQYFDIRNVFVSNFGEPLGIDSVRTSFFRYAKKAGIKKSVSPHAFRHFYAKQAALNGMDIFTLQRTLGHAHIATTKSYIQLEKEDLIRQHNLYSPLQSIMKTKR
ncbi:tyrosine-type recombinase/integrase [Ammoniphilus sp. 3BR4]|uniref:tyrosine-type recombinase/integrase n=1 Tax=Ammoniphilus sp. 3BR4 TaxID=3158265 RepID=UPI00346779B0